MIRLVYHIPTKQGERVPCLPILKKIHIRHINDNHLNREALSC